MTEPINCSADFGEAFLVKVEYTTDADGAPVYEEAAAPITLHGTFDTREEAERWITAYPEFDDVADITVITINRVRPKGESA